ncbi:uncharacterized protein [Medicago truncatula]|uniref:uncharacterized protein n=1 Tax=Medicago truncatula TaxID=3880 RepID=UPI000D2F25F9|nr:uncharacterized protein LOC112416675 [Medicago truncatula]
MALSRGLSDHCPIQLCIDIANWGPKPVRMLKCWENFTYYNSFVREIWSSYHLEGWGGYVLREKLKLIKLALKEWHRRHSQNLPARITLLKDRIEAFEVKAETSALLEEEIEDMHRFSEELFSLSRINSSICWQQSRLQWLREGDANSKFFHNVMSNRSRRNAIPFILVDGVLFDGVENVRATVYNHFSSHFQARCVNRPRVDLIKPFSLEEVKKAVWDCDSFKSPGPDGISFGFVKEFLDVLKCDVMRFLVEFHRNSKLAKGINSTFIALIPKVDSPQGLNDFRPISLSAFIKGRQILDGILVANEVVDDARKRKKDLLLFKVDFEKAYDSVD